MSVFLSRADKTATNTYYDIDIDPETNLPLRIRVTLLTGQKDATITKDGKIVDGEHVAFYFDYRLELFDETEVEMPASARKALASIR